MKTSRGFTLIELLVVISIVALLSSVVLASLNSARGKARVSAGMRFAQSTLSALGADAVALYNFEEGSGSVANDLSLSDNDGTVSGASWSSSTYGGASRYALSFDGSNDYVHIPHRSNHHLRDGLTVSVWVNPRSLGETNGIIVDKSTDTSAGGGFRLLLSNANDRAFFSVNGTTNIYTADGSIPYDGSWKHVAVTVLPNGKTTLYVNGAQSGAGTTGALSGITTTNSLCIGNRSAAGTCNTDRTFDGWIDDVRIYSSVLGASEVGKIYAEGLSEGRFAHGVE